MNRIIEILIRRDGMTKSEAQDFYDECREQAFDNPDDADNILMYELGLEPDYLFDLIC